jgi:ribosomal protein S18 acetylase RimI-like enzyme
VEYRLYSPTDFPALYAIEEVCFQPPLRFGKRYMRQLVEAADAATWIAEEDSRMAGFAIVEWAEGTAYIQTLEVLPERRGTGVGGELLRLMEGSAQASNAEMIWLHVDAENVGAIRLYEKHGYRYENRQEDYYGRGRAALIYAKRLQGGLGS